MESQLIYAFESAQVANRFINTLKNWPKAEVNAKLYRGTLKVQVSYTFDEKGFDSTAADLDDLASQFDGHEVHGR